MLLKCFLSICVIVVAIYTTYFPGRHAVHYNYIEDELISSELLIEKRTNIEPNLKPCNYYDLIVNNYEVDINDIYNEKDIHAPQPGTTQLVCLCLFYFKCCLLNSPYSIKTNVKINQ